MKLALSVLFDVVKIELHCGDAYRAQVLFDDINDRLQMDGHVRLDLTDKPKGKDNEPA